MEQPLSRQVFAPILEAYCCHCGEAILSKLIEEVHILNRYVEIAVTVKKRNSLVSGKHWPVHYISIPISYYKFTIRTIWLSYVD